MDALNHFETKTTFRLVKLEYLLALGVSFYFLFTNLGDVRWWLFAGLFLYIDLIGYIPGAIAYHRSTTKQISKVFYVLYNTMHSLATQGTVAILWCVLVKPEWALLALPIHLMGDRALFGNSLKSFAVNFEPVVHPAFARLQRAIGDQTDLEPTSVPAQASASAEAEQPVLAG